VLPKCGTEACGFEDSGVLECPFFSSGTYEETEASDCSDFMRVRTGFQGWASRSGSIPWMHSRCRAPLRGHAASFRDDWPRDAAAPGDNIACAAAVTLDRTGYGCWGAIWDCKPNTEVVCVSRWMRAGRTQHAARRAVRASCLASGCRQPRILPSGTTPRAQTSPAATRSSGDGQHRDPLWLVLQMAGPTVSRPHEPQHLIRVPCNRGSEVKKSLQGRVQDAVTLRNPVTSTLANSIVTWLPCLAGDRTFWSGFWAGRPTS